MLQKEPPYFFHTQIGESLIIPIDKVISEITHFINLGDNDSASNYIVSFFANKNETFFQGRNFDRFLVDLVSYVDGVLALKQSPNGILHRVKGFVFRLCIGLESNKSNQQKIKASIILKKTAFSLMRKYANVSDDYVLQGHEIVQEWVRSYSAVISTERIVRDSLKSSSLG